MHLSRKWKAEKRGGSQDGSRTWAPDLISHKHVLKHLYKNQQPNKENAWKWREMQREKAPKDNHLSSTPWLRILDTLIFVWYYCYQSLEDSKGDEGLKRRYRRSQKTDHMSAICPTLDGSYLLITQVLGLFCRPVWYKSTKKDKRGECFFDLLRHIIRIVLILLKTKTLILKLRLDSFEWSYCLIMSLSLTLACCRQVYLHQPGANGDE